MNQHLVDTVGGVVLCGGSSRRMGRPKLSLPFGEETMLGRVVRILSDVVSPIVVVAAHEQEIPPLPSNVVIARDEQPDLGPLEGIAVGLSALPDAVEAAYVSSCDVPLLNPQFIQQMIDLLGVHEIAVPRDGKYHHPLAAVYRTNLVNRARDLLAANHRRPLDLIDRCNTTLVDVDTLRSVDRELLSLRNINTHDDLRAALHLAGYDISD